MNLQHVISRFSLSDSNQTPVLGQGQESAVLVPLLEVNGEASMLLCKRSAQLRSHPSQLCFPGGKVELQDASVISTALRESQEEIALDPQQVNPVGVLPLHTTLTGFRITPVLAVLNHNATWETCSEEVEQVFTLPLSLLAQQRAWQPVQTQLRGKPVTFNGLMTEHGLLWGATAKIVQQLLARVA
ncbi:CoA pyrophosphatase [Pseudoalteromonas rubra]|uniref:CoA pyrophosphatase n=1 Tax=Pseudoalteromonas rubra TaxID=43658 RepID=A0A5S3WGE7_9GAMM|nr:CoA pyrophosphatase [Pseudoalteromonas rubra]TMP24587.1 CoA pyrophosphatase [Pseudoalteromonas rubra]TMP27955.1 CoA pyrophosphatase [Pseudoalteromonas rubra]